MIRERPAAWIAAVALLFISACSPASFRTLLQDGQALSFAEPDFTFVGRYYPAPAATTPGRLWVVIEGDGARWPGGQPPSDPTPHRPVGPDIVDALPAGDARLYLARPCQFLAAEALAKCAPRYWTQDRFAPEIVSAFDDAISRLRSPGQKVHLIGYSGGGVLAAELALRRSDVGGLVTLAAPLDLAAWTQVHHLEPLASPTPPERLLAGLAAKTYPRLFVYGAEDDIVPAGARTRIEKDLPPGLVKIVPGFAHNGPWQNLWKPGGLLSTSR